MPRCQASHRLGTHQRERVFAGTGGAGEDHPLRKAAARQHVTQAMHDVRVAVKVRKTHFTHHSPNAGLSYAVFAGSFNLRLTISKILRCVSSALPRASTTCTRCGSRAAISRYLLRTRAKNARLSPSNRFSSLRPRPFSPLRA